MRLSLKLRPRRVLGAFIFSRDQKTIDHFVDGLSFGGGAVNQVNINLFIETMSSEVSGHQAWVTIMVSMDSTS